MACSEASMETQLDEGKYADILARPEQKPLIALFARQLVYGDEQAAKGTTESDEKISGYEELHLVGCAALNAFLQANVTGPVLEGVEQVHRLFIDSLPLEETTHNGHVGGGDGGDGVDDDDDDDDGAAAARRKQLRRLCLRSLDVDGASVYPYIPHIELFCFASWVIGTYLSRPTGDAPSVKVAWSRLRIRAWHYKLFTQPSLGPGSLFTRGAQWTDVPTLQEEILTDVELVGKAVSAMGWGNEEFLLERANIFIMLGMDGKAREAVRAATEESGLVHALSGALGKRTKWQEKSISQLVVLAKSDYRKSGLYARREGQDAAVPHAMLLNDDTLLEKVEFIKDKDADDQPTGASPSALPETLKGMKPDEQPQLSPVDQIILLTEATLKDAFSPVDSLTSEEILPFAVRVLNDKSANWQIYSQALLVRSRIEMHRSRTVERGVLQMQAIVDQVVADTAKPQESPLAAANKSSANGNSHDVPHIQVTAEAGRTAGTTSDPTSFFPAPKATESAPAPTRLRYINALSSPTRWHLEAELAYSWAGVGSLVSALEIFKRLRLWAEVALCLASSAAADDPDGRGSGGEEKARAIIRWRLFHKRSVRPLDAQINESGDPRPDADLDDEEAGTETDISKLKASDFTGPEREPAQPDAPRLFCILGDMESDVAEIHYQRAWDISKHRFARAQKSLGEHYLKQRDWEAAHEALKKAVRVNRHSSEMWNRLGDINLRLGAFSDAAEAYGQAIAAAGDATGGEDARTWSNLGSSLWSLYLEEVDKLQKEEAKPAINDEALEPELEPDEDPEAPKNRKPTTRNLSTLLTQSLNAYKKGASLSRENWRIWDNVITLASRLRPPAVLDMILALRNVLRIRPTEAALDDAVLRLLVSDGLLLSPQTTAEAEVSAGPYEPPRGTPARHVVDLLEHDVVPLITARSELWELVGRARVWRRDFTGAVDAAEKGWRASMSGAGTGTGGTELSVGAARDWLVDREAWEVVVQRTDELVSVLENYGPEAEGVGSRWRGKARSAIRSVLGKGRESWEGTDGWRMLEALLGGLMG